MTYQLSSVYRCEADVEFLDDTWVQGVEVHDQNELVVKTLFRLENKPALVLILLLYITALLVGVLFLNLLLAFENSLVGTYVFVSVKLVK
jgi:hypothetical protein